MKAHKPSRPENENPQTRQHTRATISDRIDENMREHAAAFAILNACLLLTAAAAAGCTDNGGCSLLGKCSGGRCTCFAGWTGASCARADLAPLGAAALAPRRPLSVVSLWRDGRRLA